MALVHHPVVDRQGQTICSAVTNLDLHDIARALRTYGGRGYYVVTPLEDQKRLVARIVSHWTEGQGGQRNPARKEALSLIRVRDALPEVCADILATEGQAPKIVVTSAKERARHVGYAALRESFSDGRPLLLTFGTAWGLAEAVMARADAVLAPIATETNYNHLSVRCAVSIVLDRLLGQDG